MKKVTITALVLLITTFMYSQEGDYVKSKWKIKAAKSSHNTTALKNNFKDHKRTDNYQLELSYGLLNYLELGVYGGYSLNNEWIIDETNITYGFNLNLHILPFITKGKLLEFVDAYVTANWGANYHKVKPFESKGDYGYGSGSGYINTKPIKIGGDSYIAEHGIGIGAAVYPFERLGIFSEYVFGTYFFKDNKRFRVGLVYRF